MERTRLVNERTSSSTSVESEVGEWNLLRACRIQGMMGVNKSPIIDSMIEGVTEKLTVKGKGKRRRVFKKSCVSNFFAFLVRGQKSLAVEIKPR